MTSEKIKQEELNELVNRLSSELELLDQAVNNRGGELNREYADKIIRAELEEMAPLIEAMSEMIGPGEAISVTSPSMLEENQE